jgi:hypothetical protein
VRYLDQKNQPLKTQKNLLKISSSFIAPRVCPCVEKTLKKGKKGGFIQEAIKKPGALRKSLGVKKGEKIPAGKLAAAAKKPVRWANVLVWLKP